MHMLNISPESVIQLRQLVARTGTLKPNQGIRLYISGLSMYGPEWSLSIDNYDADLDECCDFDGMLVFVERDLLSAVGGLDVQYENTGDGGGFLITARDPEIQALYGGCGCGGCGGCHGNCDECTECGGCHCDEDE